MPFNNQRADKTAHAEFIKNPDFQRLVDQSDYLEEPTPESGTQLATEYVSVVADSKPLPGFVHASDGSFYESSVSQRMLSTKVGYVKVSSLMLDVEKYLELGKEEPTRYIDPFKKNALEQDVRALALSLPSANLRYKGSDNVADGFRHRLYEEFVNSKTNLPKAGSLLQTLFRLASWGGGKQGILSDKNRYIFVHQCPSCGEQPLNNGFGQKGFAVSEEDEVTACSKCGMSIYPTDALRLHETITDHGGLSGGLSRIMNVAEHLLIGHTILDCLLGDYVSALSDICFFIDGPLAFFGQPAWLHRPMQRLIFETNEKLKSLGQSPMMMIGIQKQGVVAEHSQMIRKYLPRDHFRFVDDEYRNRFLSPVKDEQVFGYETYYGQDLIYHTERGNVFVLGVPYPFKDKTGSSFKQDKANINFYPDLGRVFKMVKIFESDLYEGSLVPVIIAHRNASISRLPGGKVLDIATRIAFDQKHKDKVKAP
ncbi:hypothetical protein J7438_20705 [Thalassotalea sp. G20_0]|uniref:hypothetical protein n=1 Tax=Thalassotalea sp. G20_0 TaxID=2821093 RepID=UPI001ADAF256|nr:hypothetical protein [Thalassotalea sp. G20_0]MBO9496481.1 hypothetical protein [Thalassotalea sp. G20_0]